LDIEGEDWTSKAIDIGIGAIADILSSGSPKRNIKKSVENEFQG